MKWQLSGEEYIDYRFFKLLQAQLHEDQVTSQPCYSLGRSIVYETSLIMSELQPNYP